MSRALLILRPEPGATATAARAGALGLETVKAPLFAIAPVLWNAPPPERFDAVMMTSANAARHGGAALARYRHLPAHMVGAATADAARALGFRDIVVHRTDAAGLIAGLARAGAKHVLHLAGREHRAVAADGLSITRCVVYAADAIDVLPQAALAALRNRAVALLYSPRAARLFADLVDRAAIARGTVRIATLSGAVREAVGEGWEIVAEAARPTDDALLAVAARLCE